MLDGGIRQGVVDRPLRFAVAYQAVAPPSWQVACCRTLIESGEAELTGVLLASDRKTEPHANTAQWLYQTAFLSGCGALRQVDANPLLCAVSERPFDPRSSQIGEIDFLLSFISAAAAKDLVQVPPLGIWSFRFGSEEYEYGKIPFLNEVASGQRTLRLEINSRMRQNDRVETLHRSVLKARRTHRLMLELLNDACPDLCLGACRRIRLNSVARAKPESQNKNNPSPASHWRATAAQARGLIQRASTRLLLKHAWTLGILDASIGDILAGEPIPMPRWLDAPSSKRFRADPFPVSIAGQNYLLFETYDSEIGRGQIEAAPVDDALDGDLDSAAVVMKMNCHMSYPAPLVYRGETYCTPEISEIGGLHFFRAATGGREWIHVAKVLDNLPLIDPTLFEHEGRWWLFATLAGPASDVDLHAWYAESPFGPWTPHALNPIKSDVRGARPAGAIFFFGGAFYRPSQDCTYNYGDAVTINRIVRLDPDGFEEIEMMKIRPGSGWGGCDGIHTFNVCGNRIVIDARHRMFRLPTLG